MNMRICLFFVAVLVAAFSFHTRAHAQLSTVSDDPLRHGHALLIGNSQYEDRRWAALYDIPAQLRALELGLANHFDKVEVVQNLPTERLRQKINSFIREYGNDSNARLFIYYAGHGYTEVIRNETRGFITGIDTPSIDGSSRAYDAARRNAISMTEIKAPLSDAVAKHILFVFDSCFAGTIFTTRSTYDPPRTYTPDVVKQLLEKPSRDFITAGRANERVPANSPISGFFIAALNGQADRYGHGVVSARELHSYLRDRVLQMGIDLTPQQGRLPEPDFAEGEFLFRVMRPPQPLRPPVAEIGVMKPQPPQLTKTEIEMVMAPIAEVWVRVRRDYVDKPGRDQRHACCAGPAFILPACPELVLPECQI
jgi:hypothetical protein